MVYVEQAKKRVKYGLIAYCVTFCHYFVTSMLRIILNLAGDGSNLSNNTYYFIYSTDTKNMLWKVLWDGPCRCRLNTGARFPLL